MAPSVAAQDEGSAPNDNLAVLQTDPVYQPFLKSSFQPAEYASSILRDPDGEGKAAHLRDAVGKLDTAIRAEVTSHQPELLGHARRLQESERSLQRVQTAVNTLQTTVNRLRDDITEPFERVRREARQLGNLHALIDALRLVNHRIKLTAKLRQVMTGDAAIDAMDLAKGAKLVNEVDSVAAEGDLAGIDVIDREAAFVRQSRARVVHEAQELLTRGMASLGQAEVGSSLQVSYNLGTLEAAVQERLQHYVKAASTSVRSALDARQLSGMAAGGAGGGAPGSLRTFAGPGGAARVADALWRALDDAVAAVHSGAVAVWHLQRVVSKKRDPLTLTAFVDVLQASGESPLLDAYWAAVAEAVARAMKEALARGGAVRDTLAHSFSRLSDLLESLFERVARDTDVPGTAAAVAPAHRAALAAAVAPFRDACVSASAARLQEAVNAAYPAYGARGPPSHADVQKCTSKLHEELKLAGSSAQMHALMAVSVGRALGLLGNRVRALAAMGADLRTVTAPGNPHQLANIAHSSALHDVHRATVALLPRLPPAAREVLVRAQIVAKLRNFALERQLPAAHSSDSNTKDIYGMLGVLREPLEHVQSCSVEVVLPMFRGASDTVDALTLQMHDAHWATATPAPVMSTSNHVARIAAFLAHFRLHFLSKFVPAPSPAVASFAALLTQRLAARTLVFFVRHAALLRPLNQSGKLQLAKGSQVAPGVVNVLADAAEMFLNIHLEDIADLEQEVRQHLYPPDLLGDPHHLLRAFRSLLFQDTAALLANPLANPSLPPTILLLHLFSRLPAAILTPAQRSKLTPKRYSHWLDAHSASEALASLGSALDAADVRALAPDDVRLVVHMKKLCCN